jgi:hypothetical protein
MAVDPLESPIRPRLEPTSGREQFRRSIHNELLFRAIDDADLRAC